MARIDAAVRVAVHRVQTWFDPPIDDETKPLEIREAIIEDIEQRVESVGAGRRALPFNKITVTVLAADKATRARLQAALMGMTESVAARLTEIRCAAPAGLATEIRFVAKPASGWAAGQRLAFDYQARDVDPVAPAGSTDTPRLQITVTRGQTTQAEYSFSDPHVRIGRSEQPIDGRGRPRANQIAFLEHGDAHSRTVGRAHASIRYDAERREFRVFDDGSHNGTRVSRGGALFEVRPRDPVGVTLRTGDELQVGTAVLRIQIDTEKP